MRKPLRRFLPAMLLNMFLALAVFADETGLPQKSLSVDVPVVQKKREYPNPQIYHISVRVILGQQTGIYGNVPRELDDMKESFAENLRYPGYELVNTIRLSVFAEDEAVAMIFPDYYLRLIPKGDLGNGQGLKIKAEIYNAPNEEELHTRIYLNAGRAGGGSLNARNAANPVISVEDRVREGQHSIVFPILGSAAVVRPGRWETFGGVPIFVTGNDSVRTNRLSSAPLNTQRETSGTKKFLILGIQLQGVE